MSLQSTEDLTSVEVKAIAASIYEPQPRLWVNSRLWRCPQCCSVNHFSQAECACGITRDGLPEFRERE